MLQNYDFAGALARHHRLRRIERTLNAISIILALATLAYFGGQLLRAFF